MVILLNKIDGYIFLQAQVFYDSLSDVIMKYVYLYKIILIQADAARTLFYVYIGLTETFSE